MTISLLGTTKRGMQETSKFKCCRQAAPRVIINNDSVIPNEVRNPNMAAALRPLMPLTA